MQYVDFNDEEIPIGKRKQAYVRWAMSKGTEEMLARIQANKKFGYEVKEGLLLFFYNPQLDHFNNDDDAFGRFGLSSQRVQKQYKNYRIVYSSDYKYPRDEKVIYKELSKKYKNMGWDVKYEWCIA